VMSSVMGVSSAAIVLKRHVLLIAKHLPLKPLQPLNLLGEEV
jgi:hypothetical protein